MFSLASKRASVLEEIGDAGGLAKLFGRFAGTRSGVAVNEDTALRHLAVWSCVDFISSTMGQLPCQLYATEDGNARQQTGMLAELMRTEPNSHMTAFRFIQILQAQALLYGNGYAWIERNRSFQPVALWPLKPGQCKPMVGPDRRLTYTVKVDGMAPLDVTALDIVHIPGFGYEGLEGLSAIRYARETIGMGMAATEFGAAFFGDGANPRVVVTHPGDLGAEAAARLATQFDKAYGGIGNAMKTLVIDEGMKIERMSIPPDEAQFIETRKMNRGEIAGLFRVPPSLIGDWERATWSNAEQGDIHVAKYTLASWLRRWEDELNRKLLSQRQKAQGIYWQFNLTALLRGDIKARSEFYRVMKDGVMSPNEIREKEDLPRLPGFDTPMVPANMGGTAPEKKPDDSPDPQADPPDDKPADSEDDA